MDISTVDFSTVLTAVIALVISLGSGTVLLFRGKAVKAVGTIAHILVGVSDLLLAIADAQADNSVTQPELDAIVKKAQDLQGDIKQLKVDLGL